MEEKQQRGHIDEAVRTGVEETLNGLPEAEADVIRGAGRYEASADRVATRAGHYERKLAIPGATLAIEQHGNGSEAIVFAITPGTARRFVVDGARVLTVPEVVATMTAQLIGGMSVYFRVYWHGF